MSHQLTLFTKRIPQPLRLPLGTISGLAAATTVLALRSPHDSGSYGMCPLLALTGMFCAACGVLRATHDLAHLDIAGAWSMNPLWVLLVPLIVWALIRWTWRRYRAYRDARPGVATLSAQPVREPSVRWAIFGGLVLIVYSAARNVPAFMPVLAPGGVG